METVKGEASDLGEEDSAPGGEPTMEHLLQEQSEFRERLQKREVVWVKVIVLSGDQVLVDIGEKHEAAIPLSEFPADEPPQPGRRVAAVLVSPARGDRPTALSAAKARWKLGWSQVLKAFTEKSRVRGKVTSAIKGGFLVDVAGVTGFLPMSLSDLRPVRNPSAMIGMGVRCYIIELKEDKGQMVLSRKAVLEEETQKRKLKLLGELKSGEIRIGRVVRVAEPGVFVDLGGIEGLIHTPDVAWKDPEAAKGKIERGQKVRVRVLVVEPEAGRVGLGLKQLTPHPVDALRKRYALKAVVKGTVSEVLEEGVRVAIAGGKGDVAYCPVSELPVEGVELPGERRREGMPPLPTVWPKAGAEVTGVVTGIHPQTFEVTISIRRYDAVQDRKRVAQYLKGAPPLTLGQLLNPDQE